MLPGSNVSGPYKKLGSWLVRANDTVYQAATDGLACGYHNAISGAVYLYTDGDNPPTTQRESNSGEATDQAGVSVFVRKNDYWKVTGCSNVFWLPLEP